MGENTKMSLKAFTDAYMQVLENCNIDDLRSILMRMASQVTVSNRKEFIEELLHTKPIKVDASNVQQNILDEIEIIRSEILEQVQKEPDWETYDEEDSLCGYEQFVDPLSDFFDKTEALFDYGKPTIARKAYELLFSSLDIEDDYGRRISIEDISAVDPARCRSKYLCSIYLTEKGK